MQDLSRFRPLAVMLTAALSACAGGLPSGGSADARAQPWHVETEGRSVELTRERQVSTATIDVPVARAWSRLLALYRNLGIPTSDLAVDAGQHTVAVMNRRVSRLAGNRMSRYLDCGYSVGMPKADQGLVRVTLGTVLEPAESGTVVSTRFEATAGTPGVSTQPIACSSKGMLERYILEQLTRADAD